MKSAVFAGTVYFLILFAVGFVMGTIRVLVVAPRTGALAATLVELPVMLVAGWYFCRWAIRRWQVPPLMPTRWIMALWFLALLLIFETFLGATLFGRTAAEQWVALTTLEGLLGMTAQVATALLPLFVGMGARR
ncbi:MAG: hypothetical protein H7251_19755 [Acetobacteraceae bacterium]|nr:hypothetical protein [Acetobacteraceae bacterium]